MTIRDYLRRVGRRVRYGRRRPIVCAVGFGFGPFADVTLTDKAGNLVARFRVPFSPRPGWLSKEKE
jgi:hypothetical protein